MKSIHIFTHGDLDGVTSYLVARWYHPNARVSYSVVTNASEIRERVLAFLSKHSFNDFDSVFFLDLDVYEAKDLIEHKNVVVVDHHEAHVDKIEKESYKNLTCIVKTYPSCCLLMYKVFAKIHPEIIVSKAQKTLVGIVNDYDSYQLKIKYSILLNWVFYSYNKRFETFAHRFYTGFSGFNTNELSMIKIKKNKLDGLITNLELFEGKLKEYRVLACFAEDCVNEIHDFILQKHKPDITIVIVPQSKRVTWRKNQESDAPLHKFAEKICNGGGHEYAAGGEITELFMSFTKKLKPING